MEAAIEKYDEAVKPRLGGSDFMRKGKTVAAVIEDVGRASAKRTQTSRADVIVTARVPKEVKRKGDEILGRIGSTPTELINTAYRYVLRNGGLPKTGPTLKDLAGKRRSLTAEQAQRIRERMSRTTFDYRSRIGRERRTKILFPKRWRKNTGLLIDTNVLIDYFGKRHPYYDEWYKLEVMRELGDANLWVSSESFTDTFYVLRRAVDPDSLQKAFIESLDFLNVCPVGEEEIGAVAERSWRDFEDCVIGVCAENVKADYIITRDTEGFSRCRTPSFSIGGFFDHLRERYGLEYDIVGF